MEHTVLYDIDGEFVVKEFYSKIVCEFFKIRTARVCGSGITELCYELGGQSKVITCSFLSHIFFS
jgi:hypothetical protein